MNAQRLVSMTALVASLVIVVLAITQVNGSQPDMAEFSMTAEFCVESVVGDAAACNNTPSATVIDR